MFVLLAGIAILFCLLVRNLIKAPRLNFYALVALVCVAFTAGYIVLVTMSPFSNAVTNSPTAETIFPVALLGSIVFGILGSIKSRETDDGQERVSSIIIVVMATLLIGIVGLFILIVFSARG